MKKLYVYMFRGRNKDNAHILNYKQRMELRLAYEEDEEKIIKEFDNFVAEGVYGEVSRLYRSVNSRNEDKIRDELLIRIIKQKPSLTKINSITVSVAMQKENRAESKWLFDFDIKNPALLEEFISDIPVDCTSYPTPNGFAIVCEHGFDTRELMKKWANYDITLKRDDMLFLKRGVK